MAKTNKFLSSDILPEDIISDTETAMVRQPRVEPVQTGTIKNPTILKGIATEVA